MAIWNPLPKPQSFTGYSGIIHESNNTWTLPLSSRQIQDIANNFPNEMWILCTSTECVTCLSQIHHFIRCYRYHVINSMVYHLGILTSLHQLPAVNSVWNVKFRWDVPNIFSVWRKSCTCLFAMILRRTLKTQMPIAWRVETPKVQLGHRSMTGVC